MREAAYRRDYPFASIVVLGLRRITWKIRTISGRQFDPRRHLTCQKIPFAVADQTSNTLRAALLALVGGAEATWRAAAHLRGVT